MSKRLEDTTLKELLSEQHIHIKEVRSLSLSVLTSTGELKYVRYYDQTEIDPARMLRVYPDGSFEDSIEILIGSSLQKISTGLRSKFLKRPVGRPAHK